MTHEEEKSLDFGIEQSHKFALGIQMQNMEPFDFEKTFNYEDFDTLPLKGIYNQSITYEMIVENNENSYIHQFITEKSLNLFELEIIGENGISHKYENVEFEFFWNKEKTLVKWKEMKEDGSSGEFTLNVSWSDKQDDL